MSWLTSSIGRKFVMGATGLFLISFLVVHGGINACIFANDGGVLFNEAAHFMGSNVIIRTMEIGLFAGFFLHIYQGLMLWKDNNARRPVKYAVQAGNATSKWYSRSMGLLGTLILLFLIMHIAHFWVPSRITGLEEVLIEGKPHHNVFLKMQQTFEPLWVVVLYVLGVISLGWHLAHGFQSAFQTMGVNHKRYTPMIMSAGYGYSILITILFASMPIAFHFGWIK